MEKKYRDITVDGVKYAWAYHLDCIRIWKDKKFVHDELTDGHQTVTPKVVAEIIKNLK